MLLYSSSSIILVLKNPFKIICETRKLEKTRVQKTPLKIAFKNSISGQYTASPFSYDRIKSMQDSHAPSIPTPPPPINSWFNFLSVICFLYTKKHV
jgi:hypothetical protein